MSLINQMLKDLAQRAKPIDGPDILLSGLQIDTDNHQKKLRWAYVLISLGLFGLLWSGLHFFYHRNPVGSTNLLKPVELAIKKSPLQLTATDLATAILRKTTLQNNQANTQLLLELTQPPLYRITRYDDHTLLLVLENTKQQDNFASLNTDKSALSALKIFQQKDGPNVYLLFSLKNNVELTKLDWQTTGSLLLNFEDKDWQAKQNTGQTIKAISKNASLIDDYQQALHYALQNFDTQAITRLKKLLVQAPDYADARKLLARLYIKHGKLTDAEIVVNIGLLQQPLFFPYVQLKAEILVARNKLKQALQLLTNAQPNLAENPDYHGFIAALYQRLNQPTMAKKIYEQLISIQPNNATWWIGLAVACESLNQTQEALTAYGNAHQSDNLTPQLKTYVEERISVLSS